jgi:enoyl-CoA hydratase
MYANDFFAGWEKVTATRKPWFAAVNGFALGGGCEVAMMADFIIAAETAKFGQPEIKLGVTPGMGGSQRLTRAIGKQRAMEYVLTGRHFDAETAVAWGIVNKAIGKGAWLSEAVELARAVAERPPLAAQLAKQAVLAADEQGLSEGLRTERALFDEAMATEDRVEGMQAFLEKRDPDFKGR